MRDGLGSVQSVLVLGGTSEIGLAMARALVADRARRVILAGRDPARLEEAGAELRTAGAEVEVLPFDADRPEEHSETVSAAFRGEEDVDLVVVAFGVLGDAERSRSEPAAAVDVLQTNLVGAVSAMTVAAECLRRQGHGTLAVLSSVAGERVRKSNYVYGASKAGLDGFAQGMGDALTESGVRVLVIRPGFVHTRMTAGMDPAPLSTTPEKVAEVAVAGLRRGAHTVWAPPLLRWVMLALRLLPRAVFRRLPI